MRPDNYLRLVDAYYYREQKSWLPWRKLYAIVINALSEERITEEEIIWLPYIDKEEPPEIKSTQPIILTREEIRKLKEKDFPNG